MRSFSLPNGGEMLENKPEPGDNTKPFLPGNGFCLLLFYIF